MRVLVFVTLMIGTILVRAASADGLTQKLQQGLFEEEANRNLEAAIKNYDAVVQQTDEQRRVVATAVFRLAECYRKLGRTNEASRYYQRVLRDFSEQEQLVKASRAVLGADAQQVAQADGSSPAMTQAEADELAKARSLVQNSPDLVNAVPAGGGSTPLQAAASAGHYHVCQYLLEHGADPNVAPTPPIIIAAGKGHLRIVELLLNKGGNVNATTAEGESPLMRAAANGFRSLVELILRRGADVNRADVFGWTAVHSAAMGGDPGVLALLLDRKANPNRVATKAYSNAYVPSPFSIQHGVTPLHLCGVAGKTELAKLLVEKGGANVNATNLVGETPLFWATVAGQTNTMAAMLKQKADPNLVSSYRETPLLLAIFNRFPTAIELLLKHGADVNHRFGQSRITRNEAGKSYPIHLAETPAVLKAILSGNPRMDVTNSYGMSLAQYFVHDAVLLNLVLEAGADPNADHSPAEQPAIVRAVENFNPDAVRTLLAHGANPNITYGAQQHVTPLSHAESGCTERQPSPSVFRPIGPKEKYCEIARLLREHGADPHLLRRSSIGFARQEGEINPLFTRGSNDWNRYTLFETLASAGLVPNPNLAESYISRLAKDAKTRLPVNLAALLTDGCTNDLWLDWGDALIVPFRDYKLREPVSYPPESTRDALIHCLTREVTMIIKGTTNLVRVIPRLARPFQQGIVAPAAPRNIPQGIEMQANDFRLKEVVLGSNLLRTSSDQTGVRVTRVSPENKTTNTWVVDLTTIPQNHDLWVRAGDVIEIPERK